MDINIGDKVIHWTYGLGQVIGIEERMVSDQKAIYYAVKVRDMTVWVPADDQLETRLRPPSTPKYFKSLFNILSGSGEPLPEDRQERKLYLVEKLKDGQAGTLCRVIRDLSTYKQAHSLNDNDQNLMKRSREALLSEWGYVFSIPPYEAELQLQRMLSVEASAEMGQQ